MIATKLFAVQNVLRVNFRYNSTQSKSDFISSVRARITSVPMDHTNKLLSDIPSRLRPSFIMLIKNISKLDVMKKEEDTIKNDLELQSDEQMRQLYEEELEQLQEKMKEAEEVLFNKFIEQVTSENERVMMEIRAGTGGDEAALFAGDLLKMYYTLGRCRGWKFDILKAVPTSKLLKEAIVQIEGKGALQLLQTESGVHRVQRVPETETEGRVHTSTVTIAVFDNPEKVETKFDMKDFRVETKRSSGKGGQHVNKTDSAVRMIHIPTNLSVTIQQERSQQMNKTTAYRVLCARLLAIENEKAQKETKSKRKSQVLNALRSEKMRTYNFSQNRVSDHRVNWTCHHLDNFMNGEEVAMQLMNHLLSTRLSSMIPEGLKIDESV